MLVLLRYLLTEWLGAYLTKLFEVKCFTSALWRYYRINDRSRFAISSQLYEVVADENDYLLIKNIVNTKKTPFL